MRNAETVLGIIHERGSSGLPLEDVYRQLFNPDLFLKAYGRIYRNTGAMTPGTTKETVDGMSTAKIDTIIDDLRHERYQWKPVRRVYIEKKNSHKRRPLGIPNWSDKLLQEVIRLILEGTLKGVSPVRRGADRKVPIFWQLAGRLLAMVIILKPFFLHGIGGARSSWILPSHPIYSNSSSRHRPIIVPSYEYLCLVLWTDDDHNQSKNLCLY